MRILIVIVIVMAMAWGHKWRHALCTTDLAVDGVLVVHDVEAHVGLVAHLDGGAVAALDGLQGLEHVGGLALEGASPVSSCVCVGESVSESMSLTCGANKCCVLCANEGRGGGIAVQCNAAQCARCTSAASMARVSRRFGRAPL